MPAPLRKTVRCRFNESLLAIAAQNALVRAAVPRIGYLYAALVSATAPPAHRPAAKSSPHPRQAAPADLPVARWHKPSAGSHQTVRPPASHDRHPPGANAHYAPAASASVRPHGTASH